MNAKITPTTVPVLDPASPTLAADVAAALVFHGFAVYPPAPPDPHTILTVREADGVAIVACAADVSGVLADDNWVTLPAPYGGPILVGAVAGATFYAGGYLGDLNGGTWAAAAPPP